MIHHTIYAQMFKLICERAVKADSRTIFVSSRAAT